MTDVKHENLNMEGSEEGARLTKHRNFIVNRYKINLPLNPRKKEKWSHKENYHRPTRKLL